MDIHLDVDGTDTLLRMPCRWWALLIGLFVVSTSSVAECVESSLDQSVSVRAEHNGNVVEKDDGTPALIVVSDGSIPLQNFRVEADPLTHDVYAVSEGEALFFTKLDDPTTPVNDRQLTYSVQTNILAFATGLINLSVDEGEAQAFAKARVDGSDSGPDRLGQQLRYSFTWNIATNGLSQFTELENRSFATMISSQDSIVFEAPKVSEPFDSKTTRKTGLYLDAANGPPIVTIWSDVKLTHKWPPVDPAARLDVVYIDYPQQYTEVINLRLFDAAAGASQAQALTPDELDATRFRFRYVPTGMWFDPTTASGFTYRMLDDDVLFDQILDFPTGLDGPVTVSAEGQQLGQYGPGDNLDFVSVLGHGVSRFEVTDISPFAQVDDTPGFSLQLGFSEETASFSIEPTGSKMIRSPIAVLNTDLGVFSADTPLDNMINQTGLDKPFDNGESFDDYFSDGIEPLAQGDYQNNWQSQFSFDLPLTGSVDFDFGEVYAMDRLAIWNRNLENITLLVAESSAGPWQEVGDYTLENKRPFGFSYAAEVLEFDTAHDARYLRLEVDSTYLLNPTDTFAYAIVGEIAASVSTADVSVPLLGDFNEDGELSTADIDALVEQIVAGTNDEAFDLSGDSFVDHADLTTWLSGAAQHNGFSEAYLAGDSNLDGVVDSEDLNNLAINWRQDISRWSGGDFTADGIANSADLNELALNWRQSIPIASSASAPVPEPSALLLSVIALGLCLRNADRRQPVRRS